MNRTCDYCGEPLRDHTDKQSASCYDDMVAEERNQEYIDAVMEPTKDELGR